MRGMPRFSAQPLARCKRRGLRTGWSISSSPKTGSEPNEDTMRASDSAKGAEGALFFRHWLRHPLGIGAILPSSSSVARAMARDLPLSRPGAVLELGGGTGMVPRRVLEAGCPPARLIVGERGPALAAVLRRRLPPTRDH